MEGAFAAALSLNGAIRLVRDPSGQKALYWTVTPKRLLFAGEVKALFADPDEPRELRMGALAEYLTFSFVPGEGTMFRGVYELQPGHMLLYENGAHKVRRFFSFEDHEWNENSSRSENYYVEETRKCLETSVAESLSVNDDPAVFLSGGIDSSAVLAVAANQRPDHRFRTFSVHFGSKYVNENQYIDLIVGKYDTRHSWLQIEPGRFLKKMDEIIWRLDEPIGDPITVPNYLLAEAASKDTNLVLNGEGGDPCFGGPKNIPMMLAAMYGPGQSANSRAGWLEKRYLASYRKCFSDLSLIMNQDAFRESGGYERLSTIITPFFQAEKPREFLNKLMSINIRLKGANLILVKVDKMTSANGVLALAPLFSKRIIINSMACPPWMKLNGNVEKSVLKRAVLDITPHEIVARPKSGMMVPVRFWLQGEMKRYAKRALSKKQLKKVGLFDPDYVSKILKYDKTEVQGARHGLKLWMLITFMLWHDRMLEGKY
jgi:asparagine synthase (glutamine-hydrolysing)